MGGKLSPPMERLIFRAVLAQRDPVEFCNKSVYTNLSSLIKYVSHATHMIPLLLLFRDETVKYSPYKYVYAHASEFQKYICPPVLFFYFILPTRWKYYSCYFFFFFSLFLSLRKFELQSCSIPCSFQRGEWRRIWAVGYMSRREDDTLWEVGSINKK